jgi:predicted histidine transporter YuiF (NhaC family)
MNFKGDKNTTAKNFTPFITSINGLRVDIHFCYQKKKKKQKKNKKTTKKKTKKETKRETCTHCLFKTYLFLLLVALLMTSDKLGQLLCGT